MSLYKKVACGICKNKFEYGSMYEYRGGVSCEHCFDKLQEQVDRQRNQVIQTERHKTDRFKGLDMSDSPIGKANREILKRDIEIAKNEGFRI